MKTNSYARRKRLIREAKDKAGSMCCICGFKGNYAALDFHHLENKSFPINSATMDRPVEYVEKELLKCVLLCRNCHADIHNIAQSTNVSATQEKIDWLNGKKFNVVV